MTEIFSLDITEPTSCLHHLLPEPREPRSFLGLEPIRNILEFTLEPNVTAPLSTMR